MKARLTGFAATLAIAAITFTGVAAAGQPTSATRGAQAVQPSQQELAALTGMVESSSHNPKVSVTSIFAGPSGLTGMVIHQPGAADSVAWVTADHKVVIPGAIYDAFGNDLTRNAMYTAGVYETPERALHDASAPAARPIMDGTAGPVVTFFLDANCIYCHMFYDEIQPYVRTGKFRVRYVMVGVIKPTSAPRASAILAAADPLKAIAKDEAAFDVKDEEGGYPVAAAKNAAETATVTANNELMRRVGSNGTPTLLFCSTGKVQMQQGMPHDISAWASTLSTEGAAECR
ncbi:MAG: thiol:disulfide interchange protein DsbG [Rhodanobacteraceae bacterium]|nr:MAG: thiol:disulfide interchange protein DsbG [Rhodanobacteraceae bacterium]